MNPLQDLRDIQPPTAIDIWPPAYGWWILLGSLLIISVSLIRWAIKARRIRRAKRQALKALRDISNSSHQNLSDLNQLLKRAALSYFHQQNPQALHGESWVNFLITTLPDSKSKQVAAQFSAMQAVLYQANSEPESDFSLYVKSVETWLKHALPPKSSTLSKLVQKDA